MTAVIFLLAAMAAWAQADTSALTRHLQQWRSVAANDKPGANEAMSKLHDRLSAWLDERVKSRRTAEEMNAELREAGLLYQEQEVENGDRYSIYKGLVSAITTKLHPELLEVRAGVGISCGFQSVIALYRRDTMARIGYVWHYEQMSGAPVRYEPLVVTPAFVAVYGQDWWCQSTLGGAVLTIYDHSSSGLRPIFDSSRIFIRRSVDGSVTAAGDTVTFRYGGFSFDMGIMDRPAIERYRIADGKATRIAPLAESRIGVIEEWIELPPDDAARFATPVAAALHAREAKEWKEKFIYDGIERCGPQRWQIKIENGLHFILDGANSTTARIAEVRRTPIPGCKPEKSDLLWAQF